MTAAGVGGAGADGVMWARRPVGGGGGAPARSATATAGAGGQLARGAWEIRRNRTRSDMPQGALQVRGRARTDATASSPGPPQTSSLCFGGVLPRQWQREQRRHTSTTHTKSRGGGKRHGRSTVSATAPPRGAQEPVAARRGWRKKKKREENGAEKTPTRATRRDDAWRPRKEHSQGGVRGGGGGEGDPSPRCRKARAYLSPSSFSSALSSTMCLSMT